MNATGPQGPLERIVGLDDQDEPPVIGAGDGRSRPPSSEEMWMAGYVARMVECGIDAKDAWACCRAGADWHDYTTDPREAADDELSMWSDDGDG